MSTYLLPNRSFSFVNRLGSIPLVVILSIGLFILQVLQAVAFNDSASGADRFPLLANFGLFLLCVSSLISEGSLVSFLYVFFGKQSEDNVLDGVLQGIFVNLAFSLCSIFSLFVLDHFMPVVRGYRYILSPISPMIAVLGLVVGIFRGGVIGFFAVALKSKRLSWQTASQKEENLNRRFYADLFYSISYVFILFPIALNGVVIIENSSYLSSNFLVWIFIAIPSVPGLIANGLMRKFYNTVAFSLIAAMASFVLTFVSLIYAPILNGLPGLYIFFIPFLAVPYMLALMFLLFIRTLGSIFPQPSEQ